MNARLYHYTCRDGRRAIEASGQLRPNYHPILGEAVVWLTDLDQPIREALGLTSFSLSCDRTEHRFEVAVTESCMPWSVYARELPRHLREELESAPGVMPRHWWVWVSREPVPVAIPAVLS